jgi:hypothetical protein
MHAACAGFVTIHPIAKIWDLSIAMEDLLPHSSRFIPTLVPLDSSQRWLAVLVWFVELCVVKHASDVFAGNFDALPKKKCSAASIGRAAFILAASAFYSMRFILFPIK